MSSRRVLKAAEAIREVVSMAILTELQDPRVRNVTVTHVEVSPDMRQARVSVSIMASDSKQALCLKGLESAAGFLQAKVASRIDTRYTPRLSFAIDQGVKRSIEVSRILRNVLPPVADADADANEESESLASADDNPPTSDPQNLDSSLDQAAPSASPVEHPIPGKSSPAST